MDLLERRVRANRELCLEQHVARIEAGVHEHRRNARLLLAVDDAPLHRRRTAVARQERAVHIDAAVRRDIEDALRENLAEGHDDHEVWLLLLEEGRECLFLDLLRLPYGQA